MKARCRGRVERRLLVVVARCETCPDWRRRRLTDGGAWRAYGKHKRATAAIGTALADLAELRRRQRIADQP